MARRKEPSTRVTATIPESHLEALERMATRDGTSVAHCIRRAIERVVTEDQGGLLLGHQGGSRPLSNIRGRERASPGGRDAA